MIRIFNQYVSAKTLLLIVIEGLLVAFSSMCALRLRLWESPYEFGTYTTLLFSARSSFVVVLCLMCFYYNDMYDPVAVPRGEQFIRLQQGIGAACLLHGFLYFLAPGISIGRGVFLISMALVTVLIALNRALLAKFWPATTAAQNVLILGTQGLALDVAREIANREDLNINLTGFVGEDPVDASGSALFGRPIVGSMDAIEDLANQYGVSRIIVALEDRRGMLPAKALVRLRVQGTRIEDAHCTIAALTGRVWLRTVRPSWFLFSDGFCRSRLQTGVKRLLDLFLGVVGLVLSSPLMAITAIIVRLDSKGPIIYRQIRVGWKAKNFELLKFRSMRMQAEAGCGAKWASQDDPRVTRAGKYLRKFRLDELPQFINVIRGDMSLVGPRPERPVFVDQLRLNIPYYDERHSVRPGITGWAQVKYHYGSSVEDAYRKLEYDLFYLKNVSVLFDCAIVIQTIRTVLGGHGSR
jgi:sugar transferase (PEP-CTERM system associated)